jgi:hypothetical protein
VAYRISVWESLPCFSYRVVRCDQVVEDPGSKISICRVLASSLKTKGRRPLLTKKGNRMNVVISWEQLVDVVCVQRGAEVVAVRSWELERTGQWGVVTGYPLVLRACSW